MIDQMQQTITELREMLNEAHALNRRQAGRIEGLEAQVTRLQEGSTAELLKHREAIAQLTQLVESSKVHAEALTALAVERAAQVADRCRQRDEKETARSNLQGRITELQRIQSAHLSELDDYGRTVQRLNGRVAELERRVSAYEEEMNPQDVADISAALAKGVSRG